MKRIDTNVRKLLSTSFMLLAIAAVMIAGAEKAFANPGPAHAGNPPLLQIVQGGQGQMKISALAINTFGAEIAIYSNEGITLLPNNPCPLPAKILATNLKYQLMDADGDLVGYRLLAAADFVQVPWGHGIFIPALQVQTSAGGSLVKGATTTAATFPLHWEEVDDGNPLTADDTSNVTPLPDIYRLASCGTEGPLALNYQDSGAFVIVLPVGGDILPIDASALLIAGLFTTPLMILPVVGAAAGTALTIYKLRK